MEVSHKAGTVIANRYRILARIGEGGFGTVYKARDRQKHGKIVALKEINMVALSTQEKIEVTDTFNREITLLSQLKHNNLPSIYDHFTDPEHWYIVMDYIEGQTLDELLTRTSKARLSVRQTVKIGIALCDVLTYLHVQNPAIIFRDVKPGNIMFTLWDRLYLIDFGIARRYRPGQARDTGPLGSPGYAAPEQYGSAQTTVQTDIYGLGATLQTLLTGKEPLDIRLEGLPTDIRIPWKLQALILQMMDRDPSKRPRSMAEVKKALTGLNLLIPNTAFGWSTFSILYFLFMTFNESGFIEAPFSFAYLMVALVLFIGYGSYGLVRAWRVAPAGLSAKSMFFIMKKQLTNFLLVFLPLTICVALLYALLAHPYISMVHAFFLWISGIFVVLIALIVLIAWIRSRIKLPKRHRSSAQVQMPPPLQQQKRP